MKNGQLVLVVEDDDDDLFLLKRELTKVGTSTVKHAADGRMAIEYLAGNGAFADRAQNPVPSIVFLDLKIPQVDGHGVLAWIRAQPQLEGLRVCVLTGSDEPTDRARVESFGGARYFVKPLLAAQLMELFE